MFGKKTARYEAEVDVRTADGRHVTYRGDGVGDAGETGERLLDGAEAAARAAEPGGHVVASRVRKTS